MLLPKAASLTGEQMRSGCASSRSYLTRRLTWFHENENYQLCWQTKKIIWCNTRGGRVMEPWTSSRLKCATWCQSNLSNISATRCTSYPSTIVRLISRQLIRMEIFRLCTNGLRCQSWSATGLSSTPTITSMAVSRASTNSLSQVEVMSTLLRSMLDWQEEMSWALWTLTLLASDPYSTKTLKSLELSSSKSKELIWEGRCPTGTRRRRLQGLQRMEYSN